MSRLQGKVAIITGGSRGQGASHARKFVNEGAKVVMTDILAEEGNLLAKELGDSAKFVEHDVTDSKGWEDVVELAENAFGPVSILVNNAGIAPFAPLEDFTEDLFRRVVDINYIGVFLGMKAVLPSMRKTGNGSIVNISSADGFRGHAGGIAYNSTKWAVRGLTRVAALEFAPLNIRVNSVHPGLVDTPILEPVKDFLQNEINRTPMGRVARPEELSNLVLFLASDESSYSTGSEFIADGGLLA